MRHQDMIQQDLLSKTGIGAIMGMVKRKQPDKRVAYPAGVGLLKLHMLDTELL